MAHILIIDDDKTHRRIIGEILKANGHQVAQASEGEMGLRMQAEHAYELIITDILMPGMEGIETVREMIRRYPDAKIVAVSAYQHGYLDAARKFGAMAALRKPFTPDELAACVRDCLAREARPAAFPRAVKAG